MGDIDLKINLPKKDWILGAKFAQRMPHHDGIKALWETKWKFPCSKGVYPFHEGKLEDFEPVFEELIANNINDGYGETYTRAFFPAAESLTKRGDEACASNDLALASELYLRAACVLRISRFPYISNFPVVSSECKWQAWQKQKEIYMRAASKWYEPVKEVFIEHTQKQGEDRETIPLYVRLPAAAMKGGKVPAILLMTGLDGYRPDNTERTNEFLKRGWACVTAEIPGTADCPADPKDPESPDRLWSSVLNWMEKQETFDMQRVGVWGLSCGGYYAIRIAHTHKDRLKGSVGQGAAVHYFFGDEWMETAGGHEYPFALEPALNLKHGFQTMSEFRKEAQKKFSLLETGIIQKPSTRLLLINGTHDGLMPIEDSMLLMEHGTPKEARFFTDALHMGYPLANSAVYPWLESLLS